jgi:hypothetical protein
MHGRHGSFFRAEPQQQLGLRLQVRAAPVPVQELPVQELQVFLPLVDLLVPVQGMLQGLTLQPALESAEPMELAEQLELAEPMESAGAQLVQVELILELVQIV